MKPEFWKIKPLKDMTPFEWDELCDRCGLCCLEKYEDADSGEIYFSSRTCPFLNSDDCRCLVYADRHRLNPYCIELNIDQLPHLNYLPDSCAYRLVAVGSDLPPWHHLVCGDPQAVRRVDHTMQIRSVADLDVDLIGHPAATSLRPAKKQP